MGSELTVCSKIKLLVALAQTLQPKFIGLHAYTQHPITTNLSEPLNSRIQPLVKHARGFQRSDAVRTRTHLIFGALLSNVINFRKAENSKRNFINGFLVLC